MRLRRFTDAAAFAAACEPLLLAREAENGLPLGLMDALVRRRYNPDEALMALAEDDTQPPLVLVRTPPHHLVLSAGGTGFLGELAARLHEGEEELPGVVGPTDAAGAFAAAWCRRTGQRPCVHLELMIHELERLKPPNEIAGQARWANAGDGRLLLRWFGAFCDEATGEEPPPPESVLARIDERHVLLWCNPEPVSMACLSRGTPNGAWIAPVYTPPEHRRRGYAGAVTAELCRRAQEEGARCVYLFTDRSNAGTARIYRRLGFQPVAPWTHWRFDPPES